MNSKRCLACPYRTQSTTEDILGSGKVLIGFYFFPNSCVEIYTAWSPILIQVFHRLQPFGRASRGWGDPREVQWICTRRTSHTISLCGSRPGYFTVPSLCLGLEEDKRLSSMLEVGFWSTNPLRYTPICISISKSYLSSHVRLQ